jgi:CRISP-associated protein Cas1
MLNSPDGLNLATAAYPLRVMSLHALIYCERLFYLEEVEEIRVADAAVYAGRRLHEEIVPLDDESPERRSVEVASETLGLIGKVDAVRKRDGQWIAYEHKRGRCMRGDKKQVLAWPSDRIQAIAYAALLSESFGQPVTEARVRYHADNVTARIMIDEAALQDLHHAIERARQLQQTTDRPPVATNENLCIRCSLAPVCLPEEERLAPSTPDSTVEPEQPEQDVLEPVTKTPRLFPAKRQKQTLHVCATKSRIGRSGETLVLTFEDENRVENKQSVPIEDIDSVVIHGYGQITTQAIHLCSYHGVAIQWMTFGGKFAAGTTTSPGRVQQRIRQYAALQDEPTRLRLAKALVHAKVEMQLRYLLRCTRGGNASRTAIAKEIELIRSCLRGIDRADNTGSLLGYEGTAAKSYFASLPAILSTSIPPEMVPKGRSKHPPRDRFNALLSFGYSMLYGLVERSASSVGLEPSFGFYHRPRSSAPPLVMDVMELFRTNIWEIPLVGSVNRMQWNVETDFTVTANKVWLSDTGRRKAISLFEERLNDTYVHPHTGQSLAYSRMVELELRLLEKEWTGHPGLFAQLRLR